MINTRLRPRLFVGSSAEGLDVAFAIQENLEFDAETTVWSQGFFAPAGNALNELIEALIRFDFAAFVFSPDDIVRIRGREYQAVRDNVIFELGLFFGGLGQGRCFLVAPRDQGPMRLPTDILGTIPLTYISNRSDGNLVAALGAACNKIRRAFRADVKQTPQAFPGRASYALMSFQDYVDLWDGPELSKSRSNIREIVLDHYSAVFNAQRGDVQRIFAFLESLADAVLNGAVDEQQASEVFKKTVLSFWPVAATMLAPPNHADEWWEPLPSLASLYRRWTASDKS